MVGWGGVGCVRAAEQRGRTDIYPNAPHARLPKPKTLFCCIYLTRLFRMPPHSAPAKTKPTERAEYPRHLIQLGWTTTGSSSPRARWAGGSKGKAARARTAPTRSRSSRPGGTSFRGSGRRLADGPGRRSTGGSLRARDPRGSPLAAAPPPPPAWRRTARSRRRRLRRRRRPLPPPPAPPRCCQG